MMRIAVLDDYQRVALTSNRLVYLLAASDAAAYDRGWKAFRADPEWARVKEETERDGPLTVARQAIMLDPAAFSPLA